MSPGVGGLLTRPNSGLSPWTAPQEAQPPEPGWNQALGPRARPSASALGAGVEEWR